MAQSLVKNYVHIIFSTKYREPKILPEFENQIHAYISAICRRYDSPAIAVGGFTDHIHILCSVSKKIAVMELVQVIKGNSSKWIKSVDPKFFDFFWQDGYAAFSVDHKGIPRVTKYINNQRKHHSKKSTTFQKELLEILNDQEINFDEEYLFDKDS